MFINVPMLLIFNFFNLLKFNLCIYLNKLQLRSNSYKFGIFHFEIGSILSIKLLFKFNIFIILNYKIGNYLI
jgi:hypothetical protein